MENLKTALKLLTKGSLDYSHLPEEEIKEIYVFFKNFLPTDKNLQIKKKRILAATQAELILRRNRKLSRPEEINRLDDKLRRLLIKREELKQKKEKLQETIDSLSQKLERMYSLRNHLYDIYSIEQDSQK
jgi:vacuolar-type H+-ATPase subunit I/STV1